MRTSRDGHSIRVLIVDDHDVVRAGVRALLNSVGQYDVDEASDGAEAIDKAIESKPNVVVLDYSLPRMNGVELARQIRARLPKTEVLMFTVHDTDQLVDEALRAGVRGYVLKSEGCRDLIGAINSLAVHRPYFTHNATDALMRRWQVSQNHAGSVLTSRERAVVLLVAEGYANKEIATALSISRITVERHRASAIRKLHLTSSAALVRYAVRNQLVKA
jgi:DNA-binding NarL/FixJ family response regulator